MAHEPSPPSPAHHKYDLESQSHELGHRVAKSAALLWALSAMASVGQLLTTAICARLLTPADYGIVALAVTVSGLIDVLSNLQIANALVRLRALDAPYINTAFTLSLARGFIVATILIISAPWLSSYMEEPRLHGVLIVMGIASIVSGLNNPYLIIYARKLDFSKEANRQAIATVAGALVAIGLAFVRHDYWAIVFGTVTTSTVFAISTYIGVPGRPRFGVSRSRDIVTFGGWLLLIGVIDYINSRIDYLLIGRRLGSTDLGSYHLGQQITLIATGDVVRPLSKALLPAFSLKRDNPAELRAAYSTAQAMTLSLALPVGFGVSALAHDIVQLIAGPQWSMATMVIIWLAPLVAMQSMLAGIESVALSLDRGGLLVIRASIFLMFRGTLLWVGYSMGGFRGIVYARIISGSFFLLYGIWLASKLTKGRLIDPILAGWRSIIAASLMYIIVISMTKMISSQGGLGLVLLLLSKIAVGATSYVVMHLVLWYVVGRPSGVETRYIGLFKRIARRDANHSSHL